MKAEKDETQNAVDYGAISIDELNSMRSTNMPMEERAKFQEAYRVKVQALPADERSKYMFKPESAPHKGRSMGHGASKGQGKSNGASRERN